MIPFDCASLSLSDLDPPSPIVGGSPLTSGGHVTTPPDGASRDDCAIAPWAAILQVAIAIMATNGATRIVRLAG
jgi:hypothetical protein